MAKKIDNLSVSEKLQFDLSHCRHENALLKTELLHAYQKNEKDVKELQQIHHAKVMELEEVIKKLEQKDTLTQDQLKQEQKHLQQLNLQLSQKLKLYEDELTAATKEHEKVCDEGKSQQSQLQSLLKQKEEELQVLEESNRSLSEKASSLEVDLDKQKTRTHELEIMLSSEEHRLKIIASRVEEIEQQCQVQITASRGEIDKYKTRIRSLEESSQRRLEEMRDSIEREKTLRQEATEKAAIAEREAKRKIADIKESHLVESQDLIQENTQLLKKIQILQQTQGAHLDSLLRGNERQELSEEVQSKIQELNSLRKEKLLLQAKSEELKEVKDELAKEKLTASKLRQEVQEIVAQIKNLKKENSDFHLRTKCLSESLEEKEKAMRNLTQDLQKERSIHHQMLTDERLNKEEHTAETQARIAFLEVQLKKKSQEYLKESAALKEKVKQYGSLIKKLRFRLETSGIKEKELVAQNQALKEDFVPSYRYREVQRELQQIVRKHAEFKAFIQGLSKNKDNVAQLDDLSRRMTFIGDKLFELESAQDEAYSALSAL